MPPEITIFMPSPTDISNSMIPGGRHQQKTAGRIRRGGDEDGPELLAETGPAAHLWARLVRNPIV